MDEKPFRTLQYDYHVINALHAARRPEETPKVRDQIPRPVWEIMCKCWDQEPTQRLSIEEVVQLLANVSA